MGPLANARRIAAMEALVADALEKGAVLKLGGKRTPTRGYFFEPTVLIDVPLEARAMNEEPFGPVALLRPFDSLEDAIQESNRLSYGLAAYAFTGSHATATQVAARVQSGMLSINHLGLGIPETPFGGIKDSGHGFEGGSEAIEAYLQPRFITMADV
jgi:succinate-semialdehyde dehydrogenase/glutarate-semialdehyde dehydrogenase